MAYQPRLDHAHVICRGPTMAIDADDLEPKKKPGASAPPDLSKLSIDELEARIVVLEAEIARCRDAITAKRKTLDSAHAIFRKSDRSL